MLNRVRVLFILIAVILLAAFSPKAAPDPGQPDSLILDSVIVVLGSRATVPIYVVNDEPLAGIEMTLQIGSTDMVFDSVSFAGGRAADVSIRGWTQNGSHLTIYCIPWSTDAPIPVGNDQIGLLYFSYPPSAPTQLVPIDTSTLIISDLIYSTTFSDVNSASFAPKFVPGYLDVNLSNCCIGTRGNVNSDSEQKVNVTDITYLVKFLFGIPQGPAPLCTEEANANGDQEEKVNVTDLTYLTSFLFGGGPPPPSCP